MSEEGHRKYIVYNERNQPVELHCGTRIVILPPYGQGELDQDEAASPQILALSAQRIIILRAVRDETPGEQNTGTNNASEEAAAVTDSADLPKRRRRG